MKGNNQEMNQLTRESLKIALISLLEENSVEQISVTTLTKQAGVSRMAYYRNYPSITALYHDVYDDYFQQFFRNNVHYLVNQDFLGFWKGLFNFLFEHQKVAKILLSSKESQHFLTYLNISFCDSIEDTKNRYLIRGVIGSIFNVLTDWVYHDFDLKPTEIAHLCLLLTKDVSAYTEASFSIAKYWKSEG